MEPAIVQVESAEQFEALHDVLVEYEESLDRDLRHGGVPSFSELKTTYRAPHAAFLAFVDGQSAGCVVGVRLDTTTIVLQRLYARPQFRGHGVGRALIEAVLSFARDNKYERVVLDTDADRLRDAVRLYLATGFTPCEPYATVDYRHPTYMECRV